MGFQDDIKEIISHPFFSDIDMDNLLLKALEPPFKPELTEEVELKYFNVEKGGKSLAETVVPEERIKKVEVNKD